MFASNTDRDWEKWAVRDAYYAVLTRNQYKTEHVDTSDFFQSGEIHISQIFDTINRIQPSFHPRTALDFGCGVGRLLVPLSRKAERVIGIDVSTTMLEIAQQNLANRGISNVALIRPTDDHLTNIPDQIDFLHSYIVFQHIPVQRGEKLLNTLLSKMAPNGMGAVHFPFFDYRSRLKQLAVKTITRSSLLTSLANFIVWRQPITQPKMQYNFYSLSRLFKIFHENRCQVVATEIIEDRPVNLTAMLYFAKSEK